MSEEETRKNSAIKCCGTCLSRLGKADRENMAFCNVLQHKTHFSAACLDWQPKTSTCLCDGCAKGQKMKYSDGEVARLCHYSSSRIEPSRCNGNYPDDGVPVVECDRFEPRDGRSSV
jgi:hypothetical protein